MKIKKPMYNITTEMLELFGRQLTNVIRTEASEGLSDYDALLHYTKCIRMNGKIPSIVVLPNRLLNVYFDRFLAGSGYEHENLRELFTEYVSPDVVVGRAGYTRPLFPSGFCPRFFWDALYAEYQKYLTEQSKFTDWEESIDF